MKFSYQFYEPERASGFLFTNNLNFYYWKACEPYGPIISISFAILGYGVSIDLMLKNKQGEM